MSKSIRCSSCKGTGVHSSISGPYVEVTCGTCRGNGEVDLESAWSEKQWARFRDLSQETDDNRYPLGSVERLFSDPIAIPVFGGMSWEQKTYSEAKEHGCTIVIEDGIIWLYFNTQDEKQNV